MADRKLIFVNGEWVIAARFPADAYRLTGVDVWGDPITTGMICRVGEEDGVADLPPPPTKRAAA